jgi:hypothetical protein
MLMAKNAMQSDAAGPVEILADSAVAVENICRAAAAFGWAADVTDAGPDSLVTLSKK